MSKQTCNINPVAKYIRIAISLAIMGLGIYYQNPLGVLGLFTLYTAVTGNCGASIRLPRKSNLHLEDTGKD
jgi:hypothetical protein